MKNFNINVYEEASSDLKYALNYYKKISPARARKFLTAANSSFNDLKKNPFYQIRYDNFRLKVIKGFPYVIHFIVEEKTKTVFVYGIRNSHQNPETTYFITK